MEKGTKKDPHVYEEKDVTKRSGKRLFYWSLSCGILFTIVFGGFYYCLEYSFRLKKLQDKLENRVILIENEQKETYKVMLQMTSTLQSITEKFKTIKHKQRVHKGPPTATESDRKAVNEGLKPRMKRNIESSLSSLPAARSSQQIEVLERTIHSFRREMFSLNDRSVDYNFLFSFFSCLQSA